jgi:hypothetical protein
MEQAASGHLSLRFRRFIQTKTQATSILYRLWLKLTILIQLFSICDSALVMVFPCYGAIEIVDFIIIIIIV